MVTQTATCHASFPGMQASLRASRGPLNACDCVCVCVGRGENQGEGRRGHELAGSEDPTAPSIRVFSAPRQAKGHPLPGRVWFATSVLLAGWLTCSPTGTLQQEVSWVTTGQSSLEPLLMGVAPWGWLRGDQC